MIRQIQELHATRVQLLNLSDHVWGAAMNLGNREKNRMLRRYCEALSVAGKVNAAAEEAYEGARFSVEMRAPRSDPQESHPVSTHSSPDPGSIQRQWIFKIAGPESFSQQLKIPPLRHRIVGLNSRKR